jgi:predicted enzyme related to lactoylglutathione lyase
MIHYTPGTPTWVELRSPDVEASVAFYRELFGWKASDEKPSSGYRMFSSGGKLVSGVRPLHSTQISPQWITYVSTDDEAQTVSRAQDADGKVLMETGQDSEMGMIMLQDPVGAVFGVFQNDLFGGAQVFNRPISLTFNLLMTRQPHDAKWFYSKVFGWEPRDREIGGIAFTHFFLGVRGVAGVIVMNERWPQAVPSHWQVSFSIDDADALAARAVELGGKAQPVTASPFGRSALITDPHGATFSISQQTPEVRAAAQTPEGVLAHLV